MRSLSPENAGRTGCPKPKCNAIQCIRSTVQTPNRSLVSSFFRPRLFYIPPLNPANPEQVKRMYRIFRSLSTRIRLAIAPPTMIIWHWPRTLSSHYRARLCWCQCRSSGSRQSSMLDSQARIDTTLRPHTPCFDMSRRRSNNPPTMSEPSWRRRYFPLGVRLFALHTRSRRIRRTPSSSACYGSRLDILPCLQILSAIRKGRWRLSWPLRWLLLGPGLCFIEWLASVFLQNPLYCFLLYKTFTHLDFACSTKPPPTPPPMPPPTKKAINISMQIVKIFLGFCVCFCVYVGIPSLPPNATGSNASNGAGEGVDRGGG